MNIRNIINGLRIAIPQFIESQRDPSIIRWYLHHKKNQLPYQYKKDKLFQNWFYNDKDRLLKFNNIHQDEDCFIICNGPSLNKMDLSVLKDYYTIGLNKIYLIFEKYNFDLSYLVAVNELVVEQSQGVFKKMNSPVFLPYFHKEIISENIYKLRVNGQYGFNKDILEEFYIGTTVTKVALQLAFIMGFRRVFIIGADHEYKQVGKPHEEQVFDGSESNHFHPDYFKGMKWHLADIVGNEISYLIADKIYKENERFVYNATLGGKLEIFERISFNEVLKIAKKKN